MDPTPLNMHMELERRLMVSEARIVVIDDKLSALQAQNLTWTSAEFVAVRQEIASEIKGVHKDISDTKILIYRMWLGFVIQFVAILLGVLAEHFWR